MRHDNLYVIMDIFSRYIVGWMLAAREASELAEQLIADTVGKHNIAPGTLALHADRGTSMRSKPVAALLVDLDVTKTHSRPHVSDDNPYSESQFKTFKYRPDFPERFGSIEDARAHCQQFFQWYNNRSPALQHRSDDARGGALWHGCRAHPATRCDARRRVHPQILSAFKGLAPKPPELPTAAWINPPEKGLDTDHNYTPACSLNS